MKKEKKKIFKVFHKFTMAALDHYTCVAKERVVIKKSCTHISLL